LQVKLSFEAPRCETPDRQAARAGKPSRLNSPNYDAVLPTALLTVVKVLLALVPKAVMAVMHTTMIRANMTAY